jgi:excisionase family DNA binding protein
MSIEDRICELNGTTFSKKSYSVEEVQDILGITRQTVYKLIKQGCFQAVMLENGYRIIKSSFDKWLDNE